MKKEKSKAQAKGMRLAREWRTGSGRGRIKSDVNGSYTGTPVNPNEMPQQDADDL